MEFQDRFTTEASCLAYLAASRWPEGFICPGCGGSEAWVLARRHLWECARCHQQTSVTAGTVMHATRTPLRTWFWAAYLLATHHPGISAKQLQRQLGLSRYETAWLILQKLRRAMIAPERSLLPCRAPTAPSRNLKAWMHGTHRGVSDQHLPVYLDEFDFRHNRRGTPMAAFQTLLGLSTSHGPTAYREMTTRAEIA